MRVSTTRIIFHRAVELAEESTQGAKLLAHCSTNRGSIDPLLYFANFTLLIIANKEAHNMKREQIDKAFERMEKFYEERPDLFNPLTIYIEDESLKEAWTRTAMEFEPNEFDYETRKWFIEDEDEYNEAIERADREMEAYDRFKAKMSEYYDELEQEEESL